MQCSSCGYNNGAEAATCNLCGSLFKKEAPAPPSAEAGLSCATPADAFPGHRREIERYVRKREERSERWAWRRRVRLWSHAIAGAAVFFIINMAVGFPYTLHPTIALIVLGVSVVVGMPVGLLVSYYRLGKGASALVSGTVMVAMRVLLLLLLFADFGEIDVRGLVLTFGFGMLPGLLIACHVHMDQ